MSIYRRYLNVSLTRKILVGFALGVVAGLLLGPRADMFGFGGELFIRLLKMIVMPIILVTIATGSASIRPSQLGRVGGKIMAFYMVTSVVAIAIGLGIANLVPLGRGMTLKMPADFDPNVTPPTLKQVVLNMVPENPFAALVGTNPLPVIFIAVLVGIALAFVRDAGDETLRDHAERAYGMLLAFSEVLFTITRAILQLMPFGVFALMAAVIGVNGPAVIGPFLGLVVAAYAGMLVHIVLFLSALLLLFRLNPLRFFAGARTAILAGFSSRSSSAIIPITLTTLETRLGVKRSVSSFTIPLGATINMDGTALYLAMETIFAARVFGFELTLSQQVTILLVALLASIGTAGVPSASLIMLVGVLRSVNLPLSIIPMLAGFDPFVDMMRTATNVTGDMIGTVIVAKSEKALDTERGAWVGEKEEDAKQE